ncbi:MAG TPA: lamin tail domain-containing protein [Candidatus Limnocylindria bacterium]|nr:lamin tail domain-containing protein [Candidatus Limnocylindria bacterium]
MTATNRYAAVCATPSIAGAFFQSRATANAVPQSTGAFPVNYPYTWLRLQKQNGSIFTGYASVDGETWTKLGTAHLTLSASLYLGFALSSRAPGQNVTAQFRDFGDNTSTNIGTVLTGTEPIGPSSRRTGLVFTEINYHPAPRTDGRKIEFIELHNSNPFFEDISGYRISGDVSYTFPEGTILPGGGFVVIAKSPSDVQTVYGIGNVTGPYTNSFSNKSGTLRLRNRGDAILLDVNYDSKPPWPLAADGAGHSLVMARASYGEGDPRAWGQSDRVGGSPGRVDGFLSEPIRNVVINEFLAHTDLPDEDYIELYNHGTAPVDLSGCWLSDAPATNKFRIPDGTIIGATGFVHFTETMLGFSLSSEGEGIYFMNSNQTRVVDSIAFEGQENGISTGRSPNGAPTFARLATRTPGLPNGPLRLEQIVINEIMYHPITEDDGDEFVEIYNRGPGAVNIGGWRFSDGIDFTFPTNTMIISNAYIIVAKNLVRLRSNYAANVLNGTNSFGDFAGTLANSGERIALSMPDDNIVTNLDGTLATNRFYIVKDEVTYGKGGGGLWGDWSDGGGSSLELIDTHSDNRLFSNWTDSDETSKSAWTTIGITNATLDHAPGSDSKNNSFQMYLLDVGECFVDSVNVSISGINGGANLVPNSDFESGLTSWNFQGTHRTCRITNTAFAGSRSLHLIATGRGDPGPNRVFATWAPTYTTGLVGTVAAKVKWLRGRPEILLRLRNNPLDVAGVMNVPKNLGSPGARNSKFAANVGPAISDVVHAPILPQASQPVVVTTRVYDPDNIGTVQLSYRIEFGGSSTTPMVDNGTGADAVAGDGIYSGTIPGQPINTLVAFYVQATDQASSALTTRFPKAAPAKECLVRFGEAQPATTYNTYRFWITQESYNNWVTFEKLSNEANPGTFVYGNSRVIYNAGNRFGGSPFHQDLLDTPLGTNCDYYVTLPTDDRLMGADSMTLQTPGNFGRDQTEQSEQITYWMAGQLGLPYLYRRSINVYLNGVHRGRIYEDTQQPDSDLTAEFFEADGDLYKVQYHFEFNDIADNSTSIPASLQVFTTTGGVKKLAKYRQNFTKRAVNDSPHNYTNLLSLVDLVNTNLTGEAYLSAIASTIDLKEWMGVFALERMVNNSDLYGNIKNSGSLGGQNCYIYKPVNDPWKFLMWDIDFCFSGSPTEQLFDFSDPPIVRMMSEPSIRRMYWHALEDLANGPLDPNNVFPSIDARHEAFVANRIESIPADAIKNFIVVRHDYIRQLISDVRADFAFTSNDGLNFTNATTLATLQGAASISVREITINGISYAVTWTSITNWSVNVPLTGVTNVFTARAYDAHGNLLPNSTEVITVYYTGPISRAEDSLVINEIMFQPAVTNADYIEIFNRSTTTTFNLADFRLQGVDFNFGVADFISPRSYLLVVKNIAAFRAAYGTNGQIAGEFNGNLDRDGETLSLMRLPSVSNPAETIISKVKYEIVAPWPLVATNGGAALQLVDASQDASRVSNWDDGSNWKFFSYTAQPGGNRLALWLQNAGEIFIDDVRLVQGLVPAVGPNLVRNGDFESNVLSGWTFGNSYQGNSANSGLYAKSGTNSLRLAPTKSGTTSSSTFMYQDISPAPNENSNYTLSFWYKPTANNNVFQTRIGSSSFQTTFNTGRVSPTPGAANSVAGTVNPYPLLWINEVQPNNVSTLLDNTDSAQPWIEIFNSSTNTIQLGGLSLSKSYNDLNAWKFPVGSLIGPKEFRVVFVDGRTNFSTGQVLHTSFRLDATNGSIVLSRTNQILDYINYSGVQDNQSYGAYPDGQNFAKQTFYFPTPGVSNNPSPVPVTINEWMASNTGTIQNLANLNKYDDWFELYNFGTTPIDLSGYYLTQDFSNETMWRIPNGVVIGPNSFLFCWADDNQQGTNMIGDALHVNFKLGKSGDRIGLYTPDGLKVHNVTFGAQNNNVSQGLYSDGNVGSVFHFMNTPTPRASNIIAGNVSAPVLAQPINRTINEGTLLTFTCAATDADLPAQALTYSFADAPDGAQINPNNGVFTWVPAEGQGPGIYSVTVGVSDNGVPEQTDSKTFQITVNENNTPPIVNAVANLSIDEGTSVSLGLTAVDADIPAQTFTFSLVSGPAGATVTPAGAFAWTPTPAQTPSTNVIIVGATDNGVPPLTGSRSFTVIVRLLVTETEFVFKPLERAANGTVTLRMSGPAGVWDLQRSSDLSTWQLFSKLTNTTGQMEYVDTSATNSTRFYRAVK